MSYQRRHLLLVLGVVLSVSTWGQTPVVYKEIRLDTKKCLQINNFEVARSEEDLKEIPLKYNAECESIDFGKINFNKKSLIVCSQYVRNGKEGIKSSRIEVLRDDSRKKIEVFFASFGASSVQRAGKVYEYRKWLLMPKFPKDYKVEVHYSLHVVEP